MKITSVLSAAIAVGLVLPAAAQTESYYVVQSPKTKKCTITTTKPDGAEWVSVGPDGTVYHTRTEAETGMKKIKTCTME